MNPDEHPALMMVFAVIFVGVLSWVAHRMKQRAAHRAGRPSPPLFTFSRQGFWLTIAITLIAVVSIAVKIGGPKLSAEWPMTTAALLTLLLIADLVYLIFFESRRPPDPRPRVLAAQLGWAEDPRFQRSRFSAIPEEQFIGSWRNLRVGLSLREPKLAEHGRDKGELRLTILVDPRYDPDQLVPHEGPASVAAVSALATSCIQELWMHPNDKVRFSRGKLDIRLPLWNRRLYGPEKRWVLLEDLEPREQFSAIALYTKKTWISLYPLLGRWVQGLKLQDLIEPG